MEEGNNLLLGFQIGSKLSLSKEGGNSWDQYQNQEKDSQNDESEESQKYEGSKIQDVITCSFHSLIHINNYILIFN